MASSAKLIPSSCLEMLTITFTLVITSNQTKQKHNKQSKESMVFKLSSVLTGKWFQVFSKFGSIDLLF